MATGEGGPWEVAGLGDQQGRVAVVTGASSGIGLATAAALARAGASVVLACRTAESGAAALDRIRREQRSAKLSVVPVELSSLESVRAGAATIAAAHPRLDLLVNNAGVAVPRRSSTTDGFELVFGTNHLGHFALTGLLLQTLAPGARVVTVSSDAHARDGLDLDDIGFEHRRYRPMSAYAQSKLANMLFGYELQHRLAEAGAAVSSHVVHPGWVATAVQRNLPAPVRALSRAISRTFGQPDAAAGARATLRAATDPTLAGGEYLAPANNRGGPPVLATSSPRSHDRDLQRRLWAESERLTGVTYPFAALAG